MEIERNDDKKSEIVNKKVMDCIENNFLKVLKECINIIRNNDKFSQQASFDELIKILFIKIKCENEMNEFKFFTKEKFKEEEKIYKEKNKLKLYENQIYLPYMQILFNETKKVYEENKLFESDEIIRVRQNTFEQVIEKLENCSLSNIKNEAFGKAFDKFIEDTFRGELGQFSTPRIITEFMTNILAPQEKELIYDPVCGSGNFLTQVIEYIKKEEIKDIEIYGTDINLNMVRTSKMNMIMHKDKFSKIYNANGLINTNQIFEEKFDVILTNPPFGIKMDKKDEIEAQILNSFDLGRISKKSEVLFMERCLKLLKKGGRMGIVLPEAILNAPNLQKVREYFEGKAKIILICSIPQTVFIQTGTMVKTSLVFLKRFTEEEQQQYSKAVAKAKKEAEYLFKDEMNELQNNIKDGKKDAIKQLEDKIKLKESQLLKQYFDYDIAVAKIEYDKGNIDENALDEEFKKIQQEFKEYCQNKK